MSVRQSASRLGLLAGMLLASTALPALAQTASEQNAAWDTGLRGQAQDAATGQNSVDGTGAPLAIGDNRPQPPRLFSPQPNTQSQPGAPWPDSGGSAAAGRIGLPEPEYLGDQSRRPLLRGGASALEAEAGRDRSEALDSEGVDSGEARREERDEQDRLRRAVDALDERDFVAGFDDETGADFARRARARDDDAYAPLGIRAGSFIVRPSVELRAGHTSSSSEDTDFLRLEPELVVESDWIRHQFNARATVRHEESDGDPSSDTRVDGRAELRLDVNRDMVANFELNMSRDRVNPSDPDLPATALEETEVDEIGFVAQLSRRFGRFLATISGSVTDYAYGDTAISGGGPAVDGSEQDYRAWEAGLRLDYESTDRLGLFTEVAVNTRDYDRDVSSGGLRLGSDGVSVLGGVTFGGGGRLRGEAGIGYQFQRPDEPTFGDVHAFLARAAILYEASALTTLSFTADTEIDDTIGGSGSVTVHTLRAGVAHALRRNVLLTAGVGARFEGSATTLSAEAGAEYKLNRSLAVVADVLHEVSRDGGQDDTETTVTMGMRLER
ncbi:outer membrane beta-barrel protein [Tepidamorphus sp. 3E244]|uniref:outer membrane beta-barrel protein n=1 Tax=Tepidamorphus sp. 3E244 TaxID=3385498 RepID=UPI0038FCA22F